jgi:hypothetical protein
MNSNCLRKFTEVTLQEIRLVAAKLYRGNHGFDDVWMEMIQRFYLSASVSVLVFNRPNL